MKNARRELRRWQERRGRSLVEPIVIPQIIDVHNARRKWWPNARMHQMNSNRTFGFLHVGDAVMNHVFSVSFASSQIVEVSSALRESVGQKLHSTDDGQRTGSTECHSTNSMKIWGGRGGISYSLESGHLLIISYSQKSITGDHMNHKKIVISLFITMICFTLPSPKDYARGQVSAEEWKCLHALWYKESRWNHRAISRTQDYGIPQRHMRKNTEAQRKKFLSDAIAQIDWGLAYIAHRYSGSPCKAWKHSKLRGWY